MLRLSRLTDYAIVILACLARQERHVAAARALAEQTGVPRPTTARVLKLLSGGGLLRSTRGRQGGYGLVRPPAEITLNDVVEAVEGPVGLTECSREDGSCDLRDGCRVGGHWPLISATLRGALGRISLEQLAAPPTEAAQRHARSP